MHCLQYEYLEEGVLQECCQTHQQPRCRHQQRLMAMTRHLVQPTDFTHHLKKTDFAAYTEASLRHMHHIKAAQKKVNDFQGGGDYHTSTLVRQQAKSTATCTRRKVATVPGMVISFWHSSCHPPNGRFGGSSNCRYNTFRSAYLRSTSKDGIESRYNHLY